MVDHPTDWKKMVVMNVWIGLILGKTAKTVSPTRPLEVDEIPETFKETFHPMRFTTVGTLGWPMRISCTHIAKVHGQRL